jgi:hypothetical protein
LEEKGNGALFRDEGKNKRALPRKACMHDSDPNRIPQFELDHKMAGVVVGDSIESAGFMA